MYKMKRWLFIFLCIVSDGAIAQSISMEFPAFAGKTYDFIIFKGDKQVIAQQDTIPQGGEFVLTIPKKYSPYKVMCRWLITGTKDGGGLDIMLYSMSLELLNLFDLHHI
jgi:hypothetical protein